MFPNNFESEPCCCSLSRTCKVALLFKQAVSAALFFLTLVCLAYSTHGEVLITEFVADNDGAFLDGDGDSEDWIELFNSGSATVDLSGWSLTDDEDELQKWSFAPGASIAAGEYSVIFASGKNRREIDQEMHTNFGLKKGGEYLALVQDDGVTIEYEYADEFPPQFEGLSYGLDQTGGTVSVIGTGASGQVGVPTSLSDFNNNYTNWNSDKNATFNSSSWQTATTGVGYERSSGYGIWLGTDIESVMFNQNASVFLRVPFTIADASAVSSLQLRMRWDDGFQAFINGNPVASDRVPSTVSWNSTAQSNRPDYQNDDWITFNISTSGLGLVDGQNILAIQGFNQAASSSDMLLLPELDAVLTVATESVQAYQLNPTPGAANGTGITDVPPYFVDATDEAERPMGGSGSAPIVVRAEVSETVASIDSVRLFYRTMFDPEIQLTMHDNGSGVDEVAGDGIYAASVPTTSLSAGEMIRWRIEAVDSEGRIGLAPLYQDPLDSDRYYGTVAVNPSHDTSLLPILETFVEDQNAVETRGGGRTSVYYLGKFYDNVQMDLHGQSTAFFPKKSFDIDFNRGNRFTWKEGEAKVKDINLLTNWADKSKLRNTLAYEFLAACGAGYHYAFAVRVERNGGFYFISDMVEDGDDRFLDRLGLDSDGALYKMYDKLEDASTASKKTRLDEGTTDLANLISGISDSQTRDTRRLYAYDNINIAATVNHLAAIIVGDIADTGHKNYYMYRDTLGTGEWWPLPWDVDLSAGRRFINDEGYFGDTLRTNMWIWAPNSLWELIYYTDEYRSMFLRRLQTLRDEVLLPDGTPYANDWYTQRVDELLDIIDPSGVISDADLDFAAWGSWGNGLDARGAAARIVDEWLPGKRAYLASSSRSLSGDPIPAPQRVIPYLTIETIDYLPSSGNAEEEYLVIKNRENTAIDLSGWTLSGAIDYEFPPGTVIPSGAGNFNADYVGLLHVARDAKAFRARADAISGGQYRFVQGNYEGQFSARGESVELRNKNGDLVTSKIYRGIPSHAQQYLRVTEIMYHPDGDRAISPDPQEFEYIELRNISDSFSLDLTGIQFTGGIYFDFSGSAYTNLSPGQRVLVVADLASFVAHYGEGYPIAGAFYGSLANGGETIRLDDAVGEKIQEFTYNNSWYPMTDGLGFSLVIADDELEWNTWSEKENWRISGAHRGSPGSADTVQAFETVLVNEILAHTDLPEIDSIELYNPSDSGIDIGGWYISDEFSVPKKYRIPDNTTIVADGYLVFDEAQFNLGETAFALSELGDGAFLFAADPGGALTGYYHGWDFKASPNGVSWGRHLDSEGDDHVVLQSAHTLGAINALPLIGPVVVSEIHYRPPDVSAGVDNVADEFIELLNISDSTVPLYSTDTSVSGYGSEALNDTWRLRNAIDFDFPVGVTLEAGERLLVVGFDPVVDTAQAGDFRSKFGIDLSVSIFGPWSGKLDNSSDEIELKRPGSAEPIAPYFVPYYTVEEIRYEDFDPWAVAADGFGPSLQRRKVDEFANDPINWRAAYPQGVAAPDVDYDLMPDWWETVHGFSVGINDADLDFDRDGVSNANEAISGTDPKDPSSVLSLKALPNSATHFSLSFDAMPDVAYTIQHREHLNEGAWLPWQQVDADSTERPVMLSEPVESNGFFRVVTPPVE
ncbi:MAG: lamin tail domain-containing protein [Opitutaceae bacterium]